METKQVDISKAFRYGWELIKKDFWYFVGLSVVIVVIGGVSNSREEERVSFNLVGFLLNTWLTCGLLRILIDYYDGKKRKFTDLFTQFQYFWRILLATLLLGVIIILGLIFLIIPGVYLALRYQFTLYFIIDKNMDIGEAMKRSAALSENIKLSLFQFALAALGVIILGAIALGVGVFVALPIVWLAYAYLYRNLVAKEANGTAAAVNK